MKQQNIFGIMALLIVLLSVSALADEGLQPYNGATSIESRGFFSFVPSVNYDAAASFRADYTNGIRNGVQIGKYGDSCAVGDYIRLLSCNNPSTSSSMSCIRIFDWDYYKEFAADGLDVKSECGLDANGDILDGNFNCYDRAWYKQIINGRYVGYDCLRAGSGKEPGTTQQPTTTTGGTTTTTAGHGLQMTGALSVASQNVKSGDHVIVTVPVTVTKAGKYWVEAGLTQRKAFSIANVEQNTCDPEERWYANEQVDFSVGQHTVNFDLVPQGDGEYYIHAGVVTGCGGDTLQLVKSPIVVTVGEPKPDVNGILGLSLGALIFIGLGTLLIIGGLLYAMKR